MNSYKNFKTSKIVLISKEGCTNQNTESKVFKDIHLYLYDGLCLDKMQNRFFEGDNKYSLLSQKKEQVINVEELRLSFRKIKELEQNVKELQKPFVKPCFFVCFLK